ncbi:MAG: hypothetical protein SOW22_02490 [Candidatus Egerieousia sp.]|nr:hypothetical protein [Candidatus Egerieousia sp.]
MRFVAGRGAAAKSHREDAASWGYRDRVVAGRGRRDRTVAGRGVAAELHREATSRAAQDSQPGAEQQPAQDSSLAQNNRAAQNSSQRRAAGGALNNHSRCNI